MRQWEPTNSRRLLKCCILWTLAGEVGAVEAVSDKSCDTGIHSFSKGCFRVAESYLLISAVACCEGT